MINRYTFTRLLLGALGLVYFSHVGIAGQRGLPPQNGIANFGVVSERLYRGAQPDAVGIQNLKQLGVKSIINLRMTNDVAYEEELQARVSGLVYTNIPMSGFGRPTDALVNSVLSSIENLPSPVFIHCRRGCDRTGTIIACYRIAHDKWLNKVALQEARIYGMSPWEWGMRRCVRNFGAPPKRHDVAEATKAMSGSF